MLRVVALSFIMVFAGCLGTGDSHDETGDGTTVPPCNDPCETRISAHDAFEPEVAVHDDRVLVAHTPFIGEGRTLEVVDGQGGQWKATIPIPDIGGTMPGCARIVDPAVEFLPDGTPVVLAIAVNVQQDGRVLFAYLPDSGDLVPIEPKELSCVAGNNADFIRTTTSGDEIVATWRHAAPEGDETFPIGWTRTNDGRTWTTGTMTVLGGGACSATNTFPTPVVWDDLLVVGYLNFRDTSNTCVAESVDGSWTAGRSTELLPEPVLSERRIGVAALDNAPITTPIPLVVGEDVWVIGSARADADEVPTVWRRSADWGAEALDALQSSGSTTPAAAVNGDRVQITAFQYTDDWAYMTLGWDGTAWGEPVALSTTPIIDHGIWTKGMGHYMGLAAEGEGFRAAWVAGSEGERVLMTAHIP